MYSGEWEAGSKEGRGTFTYQNGETYRRAFHCDRMTGKELGEEEEEVMRPRTPLGSLIGKEGGGGERGERGEGGRRGRRRRRRR